MEMFFQSFRLSGNAPEAELEDGRKPDSVSSSNHPATGDSEKPNKPRQSRQMIGHCSKSSTSQQRNSRYIHCERRGPVDSMLRHEDRANIFADKIAIYQGQCGGWERITANYTARSRICHRRDGRRATSDSPAGLQQCRPPCRGLQSETKFCSRGDRRELESEND
jgi:hypothetical protein